MGMQTSTFPQFCATRFVAAVMLVLLLCSVTIEASACAADFEMQGDIAMSVSNNDSKIQNTHVRDAAPDSNDRHIDNNNNDTDNDDADHAICAHGHCHHGGQLIAPLVANTPSLHMLSQQNFAHHGFHPSSLVFPLKRPPRI